MGHPPGTSRDITGVCISGHPRHVPPGCPSMTSIMSDVIAGRIELLDPIARGATGSLWRAIDRRHGDRSEEHTSELQSRGHLVCRLLLEKKKIRHNHVRTERQMTEDRVG